MPSTYRVELRTPIDIANDVDAAQYLTGLSSDPTNVAGTGVQVTTPSGTLFVPFTNVLAVIETSD
jgi:hypothetical protein